MANFQFSIESPKETIPRLGKPKPHCKKNGRSAFGLATAWMQQAVVAGGLPPNVRSQVASSTR
jgi:hypothetical protein